MNLRFAAPGAAEHSNALGTGFMVAAGLGFATYYAVAKLLSDDVHPIEIVGFRNAFTLLVLLPMFWRGDLGGLKSPRWRLHLGRGVIQCASVIALFVGISMIPLAEATALSSTSPLFAALGAMLILREPLRLRRCVAIAAGLAGMAMILRPGFEAIDVGALLIIGSAVLFAAGKLMAKSLARTETSPVVVAYSALVVAPISLLAAIFVWTWPTLDQLAWLIVIGIVGTVAQLAMVQAYRHADMTVVEPLSYLRLLWAALFGMLIFAEFPDAWTWAGAAVIAIGATMLVRAEVRGGRSAPNAG